MHHYPFSLQKFDSDLHFAGGGFDNPDLHCLHNHTDEVLQKKEKIAEESESVC